MMPSRSYARTTSAFAALNASSTEMRWFLSASAVSPVNASMKYPPNSVANFSAAVRVAVTIVRPGAASSLRNGALDGVVSTNTTCFEDSFPSSGAKSAGVMSGPGRLNFAVRSAYVPFPINTTNTTSSGAAVAASFANAPAISARVALPLILFASRSGRSDR